MLENYRYTQTEQKKLLDSMKILVDTREKEGHNDHILNYFDQKKIPWKRCKLNYGDYACMIPADENLGIPRDLYFDKEICIERKANLDEWVGNMIKDKARIKKELALAPQNKILIIENNNYGDILQGNYRSEFSVASCFGSFHSLWHEFNIPIMFMPDSSMTGVFIAGYFRYYIRDKIK